MAINQIALLCVIVSLLSCNSVTKTNESAPNADSAKECCSKATNQIAAAETAIPDGSIFNITSKWKTENEGTFQFGNLAGKVTVAAMIFTSCQSACPRIVADMKRIESGLTTNELKQVRFLLISMDPQNDTPTRLKEFAQEHGLNDNWTLICSDEDATTEIANVLGVRIKKLSGGGFDHSNVIFVMNNNGVIAHKQDGLGGEPTETIKIIKSGL